VYVDHAPDAVDLRIRDVGREPDASHRNTPLPRRLDYLVSRLSGRVRVVEHNAVMAGDE
jgi:hypothetical protein